MSDTELRELERRWRISKRDDDGERYVQAAMRVYGVPVLRLVWMLVRHEQLLTHLVAGNTPAAMRSFPDGPTPDDIIRFLGSTADGLISAPAGEAEPPHVLLANTLALAAGIPAHMLCEHANEAPRVCPCAPTCYCRQDGNTCSDVRHAQDGVEQTCGYGTCEAPAPWDFTPAIIRHYGTPFHVCTEHLQQVRRDRLPPVTWQDDLRRLGEAELGVINGYLERLQQRLQADAGNVLWHGDGCDGVMRRGVCTKCGMSPSMQDTYLAPPPSAQPRRYDPLQLRVRNGQNFPPCPGVPQARCPVCSGNGWMVGPFRNADDSYDITPCRCLIANRRCERNGCDQLIPPSVSALYCSPQCAREDA